jgi:DNA-binding response OmpR family regulator
MKILVVEDNVLLGKSLRRGMEETGWFVDLALDGDEGMRLAEITPYDVLVLDWMLPGLSGLDLLKSLRSRNRHVPALMITARGSLDDRLEGLNSGADDYLVKPFEIAELIARVNALYRRSLGRGSPSLDIGSLTLDLAGRRALIAGKPLELTGKEYDLLAALAARKSQLIHREALASALWETSGEPDSNSLDVLLGRVRRKLAGSDVEIATIRGKGFILRVADSSP